jgi:CRISPR-associated protein Csd1
MSWIQKLHETYERCTGHEPDGAEKLMPICHTTQQVQIEIVLDVSGSFRRASVLEKGTGNTMIPCTEASGGRAGSKPVNHPLCDKLQYVAGDYLSFGGEVTSGFTAQPTRPHSAFVEDLAAWVDSGCNHSKLVAIQTYVRRGRVVTDLIDSGILSVESGKLIKKWTGDKDAAPAIFKVIQNTQTPEEAFVRWRVEELGNPISGTWQDAELIAAWITHYQSTQTKIGYCMASGKQMALAIQHPAKLRHGGDKAKLVSSNDTSGYTFKGKFIDSDETVALGFDVTQKAHNALRWLIARQGFRNSDQCIVSWSVVGKPVPDPFLSTLDLLGIPAAAIAATGINAGTAQAFALQLKNAISGYGAKLEPTDDIVVMGLDSATPGRMAITFYRELKGSEFIARIESWHTKCAWAQNFGKDKKFVGAPAPRDIAEAAYGRRLDDNLNKATVERLLPCIIDGAQIPRDLVQSTSRRASNRTSFENKWEWEKCLGIACSLFAGYYNERKYDMTLEEKRKSREYLYGRLLAIAERIESYALYVANEKERDTMAARLMQRFADRPYSTWKTIELSLSPYKARLRSQRPSVLFGLDKLLDEVMCLFSAADFVNDSQLSGEFLLAYHCQRHSLRPSGKAERDEDLTDQSIDK